AAVGEGIATRKAAVVASTGFAGTADATGDSRVTTGPGNAGVGDAACAPQAVAASVASPVSRTRRVVLVSGAFRSVLPGPADESMIQRTAIQRTATFPWP